MREAATAAREIYPAVDRVLREAGGGRMAGVRLAYEFGRRVLLVQFVRGSWLCTATVDAATGEVTDILDDGLRVPDGGTAAMDRAATAVTLPYGPVGDVRAAVDDVGVAYGATGSGVGVVRLRQGRRWVLTVEEHHVTGLGSTRQVAPVPGGVVGTTRDGRAFRLDTGGRLCWETRLPATAATVGADTRGLRVLLATTAGAMELDARDGTILGLAGGPVRAAAYLPGGDRILAGHGGDLTVLDDGGEVRWRWVQGEVPARVWAQTGRVYLAGEGGLKEIVVGEGVVARWSAPGTGGVDDAVVAAGRVLTCSGGDRMDLHDYGTGGYHGTVGAAGAGPSALTVVTADRKPWLLTGHRDGTVSARPVR
ncbi:hypothetical protein [Actinoplanes sp. NBRC 101535]|uniref:hypothetical protein n=1 Tax=Actinoplanes sp. NBRC 101535 TaxID=3032196 RepID=UPI0024A1A963|nr:hypothetical protein [Actinoplanes sp. NBRC 101535]GLY03893.1 hypothetical protein Acsp01_42720 [Actinoplanes sp. NBRC 101535]